MINNIEYLFGLLLMGGVIGWLAGFLMQRRGLGIVGNVAVGVGGALLGGAAFRILGQSTYNPLGGFVTALVGTLALLLAARYIRRTA